MGEEEILRNIIDERIIMLEERIKSLQKPKMVHDRKKLEKAQSRLHLLNDILAEYDKRSRKELKMEVVNEVKKAKTWGEMCEIISEANFLRDKEGKNPTAKEIWNYSGRGELFMIPLWYAEALEILSGNR